MGKRKGGQEQASVFLTELKKAAAFFLAAAFVIMLRNFPKATCKIRSNRFCLRQ